MVLCGTEAASPKLALKYQVGGGGGDGEVISKRFLPCLGYVYFFVCS